MSSASRRNKKRFLPSLRGHHHSNDGTNILDAVLKGAAAAGPDNESSTQAPPAAPREQHSAATAEAESDHIGGSAEAARRRLRLAVAVLQLPNTLGWFWRAGKRIVPTRQQLESFVLMHSAAPEQPTNAPSPSSPSSAGLFVFHRVPSAIYLHFLPPSHRPITNPPTAVSPSAPLDAGAGRGTDQFVTMILHVSVSIHEHIGQLKVHLRDMIATWQGFQSLISADAAETPARSTPPLQKQHLLKTDGGGPNDETAANPRPKESKSWWGKQSSRRVAASEPQQVAPKAKAGGRREKTTKEKRSKPTAQASEVTLELKPRPLDLSSGRSVWADSVKLCSIVQFLGVHTEHAETRHSGMVLMHYGSIPVVVDSEFASPDYLLAGVVADSDASALWAIGGEDGGAPMQRWVDAEHKTHLLPQA
jgi:hypothetical protein